MGEIADLFATLGVRVDGSAWSRADSLMSKAKGALADLDRAADKMAAGKKAADATAKIAAKQERESAAAARAIRSLERDEQRAESNRIRGQQRVAAAKERTDRVAAAKAKQLADREAAEGDARTREMVGRVQGAGAMLGAMLGGMAAYLGQKVVRSGVELNATLEDSKNKVAGLLALAKNSDFNTELDHAGVLMKNLEQAAAKLPGETSDYVEMLSLIAQPVSQAKLGLKELEQLTISATSTALTMHIDPGQAARDIEGALNGVFNSRDRFTGPLLAARGFSGEEGRSRFNQLSADKRAKEVMAAFNARPLKDMGEALGKSFSGQLSTAEDAWHQFERAITKPLFATLTEQLTKLNVWLDANKEAIDEVTSGIGEGLVEAFNALSAVVGWFIEHGDLSLSILTGIVTVLGALAVAWVAGFWPIFAVIAAVSALIYGIQYLIRHGDKIKEAFAKAWDAIKRGALAVVDVIKAAFDTLLDASGIGLMIKAYDYFKGNPHSAADRAKASKDAETMSPSEWGRAHPGFDTIPQRTDQNVLPAPTTPTVRGASDESAGVPSISSRGQPLSMNVDVGGISVTSHASDPAAVAAEVSKAFDERLGYHVRRAMDAVA